MGEAGALRPDSDLVGACLRGEQAAWEALVERYAALIYSIPFKYGLSEADAADVFQSVCLTLLQKLDTLRDPRGLTAWLITTTSRACWAMLRQHRARRDLTLEDVDAEDPRPLPEQEVLRLERAHHVRLAIGQLSPRCRRMILALFSDRDVSYRDLSAELGMPVNSLGPTRARCLAELRRILRSLGYAESA